eukprot:CAMPEP_0202735198 /NCGR_PEP_ID=MMETSP1388-20130828/251_1 /ASSEMBLY_ACC=CAM_ASM_000864 /TAXON_ID=37098 /ORGANISM="Isochrysis sp, Strain CCMP1244" /LENGTH=77 /DNA_ID=CAMNT_0049401621 /DNA_START=104 /DNA_END=337 /DNA_ORIENTATION=+
MLLRSHDRHDCALVWAHAPCKLRTGGACQDGQAVLRCTGLLRGRRARLLGRGQDGDLQKSAKDTTLEHSLFAAFNAE